MTYIDIGKAMQLIQRLQEYNGFTAGKRTMYVAYKSYELPEVAAACLAASNLLKSTEQALHELEHAVRQAHPEYKNLGWEDLVMRLNDKSESFTD